MTTTERKRVFLAGATSVIGRPLCRLLVADGWSVVGTSRSAENIPLLRALGVEPAIVDVYDEKALIDAVQRAEPTVVIHQLTDLPDALDPSRMADALIRNAHLREVGTRHLVAAAVAAGVPRLVAQSLAFAYAPGPLPYDETWPLNVDDPNSGLSARGVAALERQVLAGPFTGIVLRYGKFYGPGTGLTQPPAGGPLHVDDAANAARLAASRGPTGIYNIAEDDGTVSIGRAAVALGCSPGFRLAH